MVLSLAHAVCALYFGRFRALASGRRANGAREERNRNSARCYESQLLMLY